MNFLCVVTVFVNCIVVVVIFVIIDQLNIINVYKDCHQDLFALVLAVENVLAIHYRLTFHLIIVKFKMVFYWIVCM